MPYQWDIYKRKFNEWMKGKNDRNIKFQDFGINKLQPTIRHRFGTHERWSP